MGKGVQIQFKTLHKHPGDLLCSTLKNSDPFWGGRRFCDLPERFIHILSITSTELSLNECIIGKSFELDDITRQIRTAIFFN
jgi:hypothetical protein